MKGGEKPARTSKYFPPCCCACCNICFGVVYSWTRRKRPCRRPAHGFSIFFRDALFVYLLQTQGEALQAFDTKRRVQREIEAGIIKFNQKPKEGLAYLVSRIPSTYSGAVSLPWSRLERLPAPASASSKPRSVAEQM